MTIPARRRGLSDTAAVASDFGLRDLRWDHPGVERVARNVLRPGDAHAPGIQRDDFDVELLSRGKLDISVLVEVSAEALGRDVIMPWSNVAVEGAAICDRPEIGAVNINIGEIEALGRQPISVEPDPGLTRWNWDLRNWLPLGAARRDGQKGTCP